MKFHATPYDIHATGFYFENADEFAEKAAAHRNEFGEPVEEYEIQFIDGDDEEAKLVEACGINQANLAAVIDFVEGLTDDAARAAAWYSMQCNGMSFDDVSAMGEYDLSGMICHQCDELSEEKAIEDYAYQLVEDCGYLDGVPDTVARYFDYEAFARDLRLGGDVSAFEFGGEMYVFDNRA